MAMSNTALSALIKNKIESKMGTPPIEAKLQDFCDALAEAIVEHITGNAVVTAAGADPQGGTVSSTGTVS